MISDSAAFEGIDPSKPKAHSAAKLRRMWKVVSSNFAGAEAASKTSGQHSNSFWDFCKGHNDVF